VLDFASQMRAILRANPRYAAGVESGIMPEGYLEAPLAYDAIWAVALALNTTMQRLSQVGQSLEDYNYENKEIGMKLLEDLGDVKFEGVSVISGTKFFSDMTDQDFSRELLLSTRTLVTGWPGPCWSSSRRNATSMWPFTIKSRTTSPGLPPSTEIFQTR
jgi:hypothetical protein